MTAATDYTRSGISQTSGDPALFGEADYSLTPFFDLGLHIGNVNTGDGTEAEIAPRVRLRHKITADASLNGSVDYYVYPSTRSANFVQTSIATTWRWFGLSVAWSPNFGGATAARTSTIDKQVYLWKASAEAEIAPGFRLSAEWGHNRIVNGDTFDHWALAVSGVRKSFLYSLFATGAYDLAEKSQTGETDARVLASVTYRW